MRALRGFDQLSIVRIAQRPRENSNASMQTVVRRHGTRLSISIVTLRVRDVTLMAKGNDRRPALANVSKSREALVISRVPRKARGLLARSLLLTSVCRKGQRSHEASKNGEAGGALSATLARSRYISTLCQIRKVNRILLVAIMHSRARLGGNSYPYPHNVASKILSSPTRPSPVCHARHL